MPQCIYCKQADARFNREHVIPEAFGTFGADTMVLEGQVCMPCNSTLGSRLDLVLARDSWESRLRGQMLAARAGRHRRDRFLERRVEMRLRMRASSLSAGERDLRWIGRGVARD